MEGFIPPRPVSDQVFVNYQTLAEDAALRGTTFLRYQNSLAFSDFLIGGMLKDMEGRGLLENTIVAIAGDHGEAFGENGLCGHNSAFDDAQTRTPLIFFYPGVTPAHLDRMTSHLDMVPTVLNLIGVHTPATNYCQGVDFLSGPRRTHTVCTSWSDIAIITDSGERIVFSMAGYRMATIDVYDSRYVPAKDRTAVLSRYGHLLDDVLRSGRQFKR
jgi:membrane-anchored protein YejM (alkaline phosphatase superfamily)